MYQIYTVYYFLLYSPFKLLRLENITILRLLHVQTFVNKTAPTSVIHTSYALQSVSKLLIQQWGGDDYPYHPSPKTRLWKGVEKTRFREFEFGPSLPLADIITAVDSTTTPDRYEFHKNRSIGIFPSRGFKRPRPMVIELLSSSNSIRINLTGKLNKLVASR